MVGFHKNGLHTVRRKAEIKHYLRISLQKEMREIMTERELVVIVDVVCLFI